MQIKEVMNQTQLSKKAIRYYEDCGLIETGRKANGYKDYSDENIRKLASVKKFRELGFSTEEIKGFYESEAKKQVVLTEKTKENEKLIATHNKIQEILTNLGSGKSIEQTDTSEIEARSVTPNMLIKNVNLVFGVISLISFILIFTYFIFLRDTGYQEMGWLVVALCVVLAMYSKVCEDRKKMRAQGLQDFERKPKEMLFRYLIILFSFGITGAMANECLHSVKIYQEMGESLGVIGNISMVIALCLFSSGVAFISFFEEIDDIIRFFKKPA